MEIDPRYTQYPNSLNDVYVATVGRDRRPAPRHQRVGRHRARHRLRRPRQANVPSRQPTSNAPSPDRPRPQTPSTSALRRATPRSMRSPIPARARPPPAPPSVDQSGDDDPARRRQPLPARATRRCRSITRDCSSPRRSRSICSRANRSARPPTKSMRRSRRIHMPATHPRHARRHGAAVSAIARQRADPDPHRASPPSTSCSACSTRATSTRSPFSRRCRRPASARCWR